ncbi:MAG: RNA polymerase sigma factor [Phycisphaerae bacterium]
MRNRGRGDGDAVESATRESGAAARRLRPRVSERDLVRVLYHEYHARALAYARRLVGGSDAEDVVQEGFLRLTRSKRLTPSHLNAPFVLAVMRNTAMTMLSRSDRARRRDCTSANERRDSLAWHPAARDSAIDRHLADLTEGQREALILVEVHGLSDTQAGLAMRISRAVVSAKKRSAVQALRAMYDPGRGEVA